MDVFHGNLEYNSWNYSIFRAVLFAVSLMRHSSLFVALFEDKNILENSKTVLQTLHSTDSVHPFLKRIQNQNISLYNSLDNTV